MTELCIHSVLGFSPIARIPSSLGLNSIVYCIEDLETREEKKGLLKTPLDSTLNSDPGYEETPAIPAEAYVDMLGRCSRIKWVTII